MNQCPKILWVVYDGLITQVVVDFAKGVKMAHGLFVVRKPGHFFPAFAGERELVEAIFCLSDKSYQIIAIGYVRKIVLVESYWPEGEKSCNRNEIFAA